MATTKKKEFTPGTAQCVVVNIRAVFDLGSFSSEQAFGESLKRALEELRGDGAAEVIERYPIVEKFEEASAILNSQRLKEHP